MNRPRWLLILILLVALPAMACALPGIFSTGIGNGDAVGTSAAATAQALQTQSLLETIAANMNRTQLPPVVEAAQPTATLAPSSTPLTPSPTVTLQPPTTTPLPPSATAEPCNAAAFVADVTVLDGSFVQAGSAFTKTWTLQNKGSCVWTRDFAIVPSGGERMDAPDETYIDKIVLPGEMVNVSVQLTAPQTTGGYTSNFMLQTAEGAQFGLGQSASTPFYMRINVVQKGVPTNLVYDLTRNYCQALWTSETEAQVSCPSVASPAGGVFALEKPRMENGQVANSTAIVVFPSSEKTGFIEGIFPAVSLMNGNHFATVIGCMSHSDDCTVTFELLYTENGTDRISLGKWVQKSDKSVKSISLDLSGLAGKKVQFILRVTNNGDSTEDRAFWLFPRVKRSAK